MNQDLPPPSTVGILPPAAAPSQDEKTMVLICHFGQIITGFIAPLVVYLLKKDESKYVAFHALESLYFSGAVFIAAMVIGTLTCGMGYFLVPIAWVFNIIAGVKALDGKAWEYPLVGKLAREQIYGK